MNGHINELILTAKLNYAVSLKEINKQIKAMGRDEGLAALTIKVNINQTFARTLREFIKQTKGLGEALENQNKVTQKTVQTFQKADGTIEKVTTTVKANHEVWKQMSESQGKAATATAKVAKEQKQAAEGQRNTLKQMKTDLQDYEKVRVRVNKNAEGGVSSLTHVYKQKDTGKQLTINTDSKGVINNSAKVTDYLKAQNEELKKNGAIAAKNLADEEARASAFKKLARERYDAEKRQQEIAKNNLKSEADRVKAFEANAKKEYDNYKTRANQRESVLQEEQKIRKALAERAIKDENDRFNAFQNKAKEQFDLENRNAKTRTAVLNEEDQIRKKIAARNLQDEQDRFNAFQTKARLKFETESAYQKQLSDIEAARAKRQQAYNETAKKATTLQSKYGTGTTDTGLKLAANANDIATRINNLKPAATSPLAGMKLTGLAEELKQFEAYAKGVTDLQNKLTGAQEKFRRNRSASKDLKDIQTQLNALNGPSQKAIDALGGLNTRFNELTAGSTKLRSGFKVFDRDIMSTIGNMARFQLAITALYAPIQALSSMVSTAIAIDTQMTQLRRVMDESSNIEQVLQNNIQIANELGRSVQEVNENAIGFARMGYDENQTAELTKVATLLQNISDLNTTESIDTLTAGMTVFNIEASKSIDIADKLNEVDNKFAVTTQDLANGITKAGATANTFGVGLEFLLGNMTAIGTATRESGKIIGNSLKTIYSRLTTLPKSEEAFAGAGVAFRNLNGEVRSGEELLTDLAHNWNNLSAEQQQNTAVTLAGRYQLSRFLALMQNWQISENATTTALNSNGSAMRENAKYMDSLQARINRMKTAWETFAISMSQAFVSDAIIGFTSAMTLLMNGITKVTGGAAALPMLFGAVGAAIALVNVGFKSLVAQIIAATGSMLGLNVSAQAVRASLLGTAAGAGILKTALRSMMVATGIGAAFAVLGGILDLFLGKTADAADAVDSFADSAEKLEQTQNKLNTIDGLGKKYDELRFSTQKTAQTTAELASIEQELAANFGIYKTTSDGKVKSQKEYTEEIKKATAALEEQEERERQAQTDAYKTKSAEIDKNIKDSTENYYKLRKELEAAQKAEEDFKKELANPAPIPTASASGPIMPGTVAWDKEMEKRKQKLVENTADMREQVEAEYDTMNKNVATKAAALNNQFANLLEGMEANGTEISDQTKIMVRSLADALAKADFSDMDFDTKAEEMVKTLNSLNADISMEQAVEQINKLTGSIMDLDQQSKLTTAFASAGFFKSFGANNTDDMEVMAAATEQARTSLEKLTESFKETGDTVKPLNDIIYKSGQGYMYTSEEVANLVQQYPELAGKVKQTARGWEFEQSAVEELRKAKLENFNKSVEEAKNGAKATLEAIRANVKNYGLEIDAVNNLGQALDNLNKFKQEIADQEKKRNEAASINDYLLPGLPDQFKDKKMLGPEGTFSGSIPAPDSNAFTDAFDKNIKSLKDAQSQYENATNNYKKLEESLATYSDTLNDATYGTDAQKDALKDAEDAAKEAEDAQKDLNDSYSETVEILTEQQKRLKEIELALNKVSSQRNRYKKGSKEYQQSILDEIALLKEQKGIYDQAVTNPMTLTSQNLTIKGSGSTGTGSVPAGSGLGSLLSAAVTMANDPKEWTYKQVSGKYKGTFDDFVKGATADCSQFVQEMFDQFLGMELPRDTQSQVKTGTQVKSKADLQPGDLVFFNTNRKNGHVGVYVGDQKFVHMGNSGLKVADMTSNYWSSRYSTARHVVGADAYSPSNVNYNPSQATSPSISNAYSGQYQDLINNYAQKYGVDPRLVAAVISTESNFNKSATSGAGARGLMQLMPATAKGLGVKDSYDPAQNIEGGVKYLKQMLDKYNNNLEEALTAYNAGPGNVNRWKSNGGGTLIIPDKNKEAKNYAPKVLKAYAGYGGDPDSPTAGTTYEYSKITQSDLENTAYEAAQNSISSADKVFSLYLELIDSAIAGWEDQVTHYDNLITKSQNRQERLDPNSQGYRDEQAKQNYYTSQQIDLLKKERQNVERLLKENKITNGQYDGAMAEIALRIDKMNNQISEGRKNVIDSRLNQIEAKNDSAEKQIDLSEKRQSDLDKTSQEYRKELQEQIRLKKEIVKNNKVQIAYLKQQIALGKLLPAQIEEYKNQIADLTVTNADLNNSVKEIIGDYIDSNIEAINKRVDLVNSNVALSKARMDLAEEGTKEYNYELKAQIALQKDLIKINDELLKYLNEQLKRTDLNAEAREKLNESLKEATLESYNLKSGLKELNQALNDPDKIIDNLKKMYEKMRDLRLKEQDDMKEAEDKRHEEAMKNIEKEGDARKKIIQDQIDAFNRQNDTDDYNKDLNKKMEERAEIQAKINELAVDDSWEAKARRTALEADLKDKNEEIDRFMLERNREVRIQDLNDQMNLEEKQTQKLSEEEDKRNKDKNDSIEEQKKAIETYYNDILEDEKKWYDMRQNLMSEDKTVVLSTLNSIQGEYQKFFTFLQDTSAITSERMRSNLQYSFGQQPQEIENYKDYMGTGNVASSSPQVKADWNTYLNNKKEAERIRQLMADSAAQNKTGTPTQWYKTLEAQFQAFSEANQRLRVKYPYFPDGSYDSLKNTNVFSAETGGMTPDNMPKEGQFLLAHEKELILKKEDTSLVVKAVEMAQDVAKTIKNTELFKKLNSMPSLTSLLPKAANAAVAGGGDLNFYIGTMNGTKDDVEKLFNVVESEKKKKGL